MKLKNCQYDFNDIHMNNDWIDVHKKEYRIQEYHYFGHIANILMKEYTYIEFKNIIIFIYCFLAFSFGKNKNNEFKNIMILKSI